MYPAFWLGGTCAYTGDVDRARWREQLITVSLYFLMKELLHFQLVFFPFQFVASETSRDSDMIQGDYMVSEHV